MVHHRTQSAAGAPGLTDGALLARMYAGEVDGLESLFDRYSGYVMAIALRITGTRADAEEVVQDVFWQIWKARVRFDPSRGSFSTWLFAVARSRALDRLRGRRARPDSGAVAPDRPLAEAPGAADPEYDLSLTERRRMLKDALGALSRDQREAIELAYYGGFSHSEIAHRVGEPLGTVKSRIKRGMEKLRSSLSASGVSP